VGVIGRQPLEPAERLLPGIWVAGKCLGQPEPELKLPGGQLHGPPVVGVWKTTGPVRQLADEPPPVVTVGVVRLTGEQVIGRRSRSREPMEDDVRPGEGFEDRNRVCVPDLEPAGEQPRHGVEAAGQGVNDLLLPAHPLDQQGVGLRRLQVFTQRRVPPGRRHQIVEP
jgi:hypothetical protein